MTFWISVLGAVLGAASLILHAVAPRSKWAQKAEGVVDSVKDKIGN